MHPFLCGSPSLIQGGLFVTALIGSLAHCMPMCGPFVLMQSGGAEQGPLLRRLWGAMLLRYQAGRLVTYVALGALAGSAGHAVTGGALRWPVAILLGLAAATFFAQAMARISGGSGSLLDRLSRPLARLVVPLAARQTGGFRLGLLLGLLPCGFLYAALMAAAATGSAAGGALAMAAFGLGTVPSLVLVGVSGRAASRRWRFWARHGLTALFLVNALTLAAASLRQLIAS